MTSLAMGWPAPLRLFAARAGRQRLDRGVRLLMIAGARGDAGVDLAEPQLSARGRRQAGAGLADHPPRHLGDPQRLHRPLVSISAWLVAALSIIGQLEPAIDALDSVAIVLGGLRLTPLLLIKLGVLLAVALWLTNIASNFVESRITQSPT
jgi:hypothetical protein